MDNEKIRQELEWVSGEKSGAEGARNLTKALAAVEQKIHDVESATYELAGATQAAGGYELVPSALDRVAKVAPAAVAGLKAVTAETVAAAAAQTKMGEAARISQQRITGISFALNDFFGAGGGLGQKITSVANNLPMVLAGFGNVGLAASALLPILGAVVTNFDLIAKSLGLAGAEADMTKGAMERLSTRIEELSKQKIMLAVDMHELAVAEERLKQLKKAQAAFDALKESKSDDQAEAGKLIGKALTEGGEGEDIATSLKAKMVEELEASSATIQGAEAKIADLKRRAEQAAKSDNPHAVKPEEFLAGIEKIKEAVRVQRELIVKEAEREVGAILDAAKSGKDNEAAGNLAARLDNIGREAEAAKVRSISPRGVHEERQRLFDESVVKEAEEDQEKANKEKMRIAETARKETEAGEKEEERLRLLHNKTIEDIDKDHDQKRTKTTTEDVRGLGHGMAANRRRVADTQRELERGDIDERATARAAELQAQVGNLDMRTGKPLTAEGARDQLEAEIRQRLKRQKVGALPASQIASNLAGKAFGEVNREKDDLTARGMDDAAANQIVITQAMEALIVRLKKAEGDLHTLRRFLPGTLDRSRTAVPRVWGP